jgi:hypothetical protein
MIRKDKVVEFFTWSYKGQEYTVIGERGGGSGDSLKFTVYIGKEEVDDPEKEMVVEFIRERVGKK